MRAKEFIKEIYDAPASYEIVDNNDNEFISKFLIGESQYLFQAQFLTMKDCGIESGAWDISFANVSENNWYDISKSGNEFAVISTIANIWAEFVKIHNPKIMILSAQGNTRKKLYKRIINRLFSSWHIEQNGDKFILSR